MNLNLLNQRFQDVADTIGSQLNKTNSHAVALVAKWTREDLVPGLSDMDFRVICDESVTEDDWVQIDHRIGQIHCQMVAEHPEWNRINEHTAGAGISLAELKGGQFHHPEYSTWTVWWGRESEISDTIQRSLARPLVALDESFHFKRFLSYYSPYIHGIDPPINLGEFEPKYPLHSRCWHYFAPPMVSAATILARKHFTGKRAALNWLMSHGYAVRQVEAVLEQVDSHYETPEMHDSAALQRFEQLLFKAFEELLDPVIASIECFKVPADQSQKELLKQFRHQTVDPFISFLENVRFSRIRAGRYHFYLNAPSHFSVDRQLAAEQIWTSKLIPGTFDILRRIHGQETLLNCESISQAGIPLTESEENVVESIRRFSDSCESGTIVRDNYKEATRLFPEFYRLLERVLQKLSEKQSSTATTRTAVPLQAIHKPEPVPALPKSQSRQKGLSSLEKLA